MIVFTRPGDFVIPNGVTTMTATVVAGGGFEYEEGGGASSFVPGKVYTITGKHDGGRGGWGGGGSGAQRQGES